LAEPLKKIGLDDRAIQRLLAKFPNHMLNQWVDITLSAMERYGKTFFRKSPAAYLVDNLNHASEGKRLPPDWWHDIRRAEERSRTKAAREKRLGPKPDRQTLPEKAIASFENLNDSIFDHFITTGQNKELAKLNSERFRIASQKRKKS
jgi:hypothetical protein